MQLDNSQTAHPFLVTVAWYSLASMSYVMPRPVIGEDGGQYLARARDSSCLLRPASQIWGPALPGRSCWVSVPSVRLGLGPLWNNIVDSLWFVYTWLSVLIKCYIYT